MCVIAVVEKDGKRPSKEHIDAFWEKNPEGAGIAWLDGKKVIFQKGLTLGEIQDLVKTAPKPFAAHFRISTCGGIYKRLTHPFIVSEESPLTLKGSSSDPVLFHNGIWPNWERRAVDICTYTGWKLPEGPWSDSRLMAWFASHVGLGIIDLIAEDKQRIVTLNPSTGLIHMSGDWKELESDGFWVSNELWQSCMNGRKKKSHKSDPVGPAQPSSQTTSGSILNLADPRNTTMGPSQKLLPPVTIPGSSSVSPDVKGGPSPAGDPFLSAGQGLSLVDRLINLEKTWHAIQTARMRHSPEMGRNRFKSLKGIYHRRRDALMKEIREQDKLIEGDEKPAFQTGLISPPTLGTTLPRVM